MKNILFLCFMMIVASMVFLPIAIQAQMLADIQRDIVTEFATYYPYPVTVTPEVKSYTVAADFSNVVNFADFNFSEAEKALLARNHFFVSPLRKTGATGYREIFDVYNESREMRIPIFITTDAMLHTFHLCFDNILKTCEEKRFYADLNNLLLALLDETQIQYQAATAPLVQQALLTNLNYLIVAEKLLDSTYVEPINGGPYLEELDLIRQHHGFMPSPIFSYAEDYSQYIVRGHYTRSDTLHHFFQSMMWLGRMTFSREDEHFTRSAILLTQALERRLVGTEPALSIWDRIYSPTVFLVGKSDDINILQYSALAHQVYGNDFATLAPDIFSDATKLKEFLIQAQLLPGPKIEYPGQPAGFRLMGQRFIPDSWILDELVYNKIPDRFMPTGLDVMAVLGSARALDLLKQTPDWANPYYAAKLNYLMGEFKAYPDSVWAQNAYWNWLYSLMPLLFAKGEGYPVFMQKPAWMDKDLFAALASWAELRHDTILYGKQSGTEIGMRPSSVQEQGYVEPNPFLYARLAALAAFLRNGLTNRGLLFDNFAIALNKLHDLLLRLEVIAEKELVNLVPEPDEYMLICNIGRAIQAIVTFTGHDWALSSPEPGSDDAMAVIADVHTDANSGLVLEEGVGYPFCIYVVAPVAGELKITRGAGFSYYEFTWPMNDRLTDEKWQTMLQGATAPSPPTLANSFLHIPSDWRNPLPDFYFWYQQGFLSLTVNLSQDSALVGDLVLVDLITNAAPFAAEPEVMIFPTGSTPFALTQFTKIDDYHYTTVVNTSGLVAGPVWLNANAELLVDFGLKETVKYRTGFILKSGVMVESEGDNASPADFQLLPNYPNPFNNATVLKYHVPQSCFVTLEIYNINGQKLRTLENRLHQPGHYRITWDSRNDRGQALTSGVYFCRMKNEKYVRAQKLILQK